MENSAILRHVDHTILKAEATWEEVQAVCDEALWGKAACVCLAPCYVARAAIYLAGRLAVCTVIGFPHGNSDWKVKAFEAQCAVDDGADELDMVINLGMVKSKDWTGLLAELQSLRAATEGKVLKVIVETCLLTQLEKRTLCMLVAKSGADYIKTSTGFSTGGATLEDVALFYALLPPTLQIKASGGIRSLETARAMLEAGAERLGSSALIGLVKEQTCAEKKAHP